MAVYFLNESYIKGFVIMEQFPNGLSSYVSFTLHGCFQCKVQEVYQCFRILYNSLVSLFVIVQSSKIYLSPVKNTTLAVVCVCVCVL